MKLSKKAIELNETEKMEVMAQFFADRIPRQKVDEDIKVFIERYAMWYHTINQFEGMKELILDDFGERVVK